ncbi:MAG: fibronectin type III domain-containing protein [Lachnospiraceae bacterium]|nr:fibronectin type III domain-containing protein [Lachnospiraceae bacterium]
MKTKFSIMKKLMLFVAAFAFCAVLTANPINADAALAGPTGLAQSDYLENGTAVQITWNTVIGASGGYEYSYSTNPNAEGAKGATDVAYANIYNLTPGTTYYVKVRAYEGTIAGAWSNIIKVDTAPAKVTSLKQSGASAKSIKVVWSSVAGATGYEVGYGLYADGSNLSGVTKVGAGQTSYSFNVPKDAAYYVFVWPYRNAANSANYIYGTGLRLLAVTKPSTPKSLQIYLRSYYGYKENGVKISPKSNYITWTPVSNEYNTDGYEVQIFNAKGTKIKTIKTTTNLALWKSSKPFSQAFQYRVRAYVTINGKKYYSSWSSKKIYVPGAVVKKITTYGKYPSSGTLKWSKVSGAQSYTVYYRTSSSGKWKVAKKNVKGTSAKVKYSVFGDYQYYVRANKVKVNKKRYNSTSKNFDVYGIEK